MVEARTITLKNDLADLRRLADEIEDFGRAAGLGRETVLKLNLVLEELATNTILHGYADEKDHSICIRLERADRELRVQVEDDAPAFDPLQQALPDVACPLEDRSVGGLGIFFVRRLVDELGYRREGSRNILTLRKRVDAPVA